MFRPPEDLSSFQFFIPDRKRSWVLETSHKYSRASAHAQPCSKSSCIFSSWLLTLLSFSMCPRKPLSVIKKDRLGAAAWGMQGIKSCYIGKAISQETAQGALLSQGPPKQLLEAHTKKNSSSPMSGSAAPKSWSRKLSYFIVPGRLSHPMAFPSCSGFQVQCGVWAIQSQKNKH